MNEDPRTTAPPLTASDGCRNQDQELDSGVLPAKDPPLDPAELHALKHALAQEFPLPVEATELVLMDVDPTRLHAFWSVMPEDLDVSRRFSKRFDQAKTVLRLHAEVDDASGRPDPASPVDIDVDGLQGSTYVDHLVPGQTYRGELGLVASDGELVVLAESNTLLMPGVASTLVGEPADVARGLRPRPPRQHFPPGLRLPDLEPEFPNAAAEGHWQSLSLQPPASNAAPGAGRDILAPMRNPRPNPKSSPTGDGSVRLSEGAAAVMANLPAYMKDLPDDLPRFHLPADVTGDADTPRSPEPSPEAVSRRVSGSYSSSTLARPDTDLELSVDLQVHGRARPGSTLTLFGRTIVVGPDGLFSINEPLPEGFVELAMSLGQDGKPDHGRS